MRMTLRTGIDGDSELLPSRGAEMSRRWADDYRL